MRATLILCVSLVGCDDAASVRVAADAGPGAVSTVLRPTLPPEHYVQQAELYFDTFDTRADPELVPDYAELVARWEWPPWLYLTGYGREHMINTSRAALSLDPSTVEDRDCRFFPVQPFARCYVSFEYDAGSCPIYEEFTFNAAGQTTFIEAWSVLPGRMPTDDPDDRWAEGPDVHRLSTRIPGLGSPEGRIDLEADWMLAAAETDPEVADFVRRASDFWVAWGEALREAGPNIYAVGCGWPTEE